MKNNKQNIHFIQNKGLLGIIILLIMIIGFVYFINTYDKLQINGYNRLAQCLTEKGLVMYGADWCPHCRVQKDLFGESFKYINYVECETFKNVCLTNNITGYPTWVYEGVQYRGTKSLIELNKITGCEI